ncbi:hypothetical protein K474DRAFT_1599183 [Panus rudis PR-1116 ss-1]|nr:hypothetical protein K474DRAFT_1599183 [Panus rudis PR-1116 ss-1]
MWSERSLTSVKSFASGWNARLSHTVRRSSINKRVVLFVVLLALGVPFLLVFAHRSQPSSISGLQQGDAWPPNSTIPVIVPHDSFSLQTSPPTPSPINFSLVMFSEDSASEGAILVKSALMYTSAPIHFHILCDDEAQLYLEARLKLITRPRHNVAVTFYPLSIESIRRRIEREGAIASDHSAGLPGLLKLFIHEILPESVERSIFVDTDAFFISDPMLLWNVFDTLNQDTAVAIPKHPDQNAAEWHNASNICSCIMLLNLKRLRELHLMDSSVYHDAKSPLAGIVPLAPAAFRSMYGPPGPSGHYEGVKLGDQGYWWAIVEHSPDIVEHLSYDWETSSCLVDMYATSLGNDNATFADESLIQVHTWNTPHHGQVVLPKLLHFNCLDGDKYYEWPGWVDLSQGLGQRWGAAVLYHAGSKWIWLNQAQPNSTSILIQTHQDVHFADERYILDNS